MCANEYIAKLSENMNQIYINNLNTASNLGHKNRITHGQALYQYIEKANLDFNVDKNRYKSS
jgi:hypothetical protein